MIRLGADVPPADVARAVGDFGADALALSAALVTHVRTLARRLEAVRAAALGVRVLVGGGALSPAPDLGERLGADATGATIGQAADVARRLVGLDSNPD